MPIDYKKYPSNWKTEIRPRILKRANDCCEFCQVKNHSLIHSFKENGKTVWRWLSYGDFIRNEAKTIKVVLTIAHLDHDKQNENIKDDRLKALCQLCNLRYDAPEKARRKKLKNATQTK